MRDELRDGRSPVPAQSVPTAPTQPAPGPEPPSAAGPGETAWFPDGELFAPPIAGVHEIRSQIAYERLHADEIGTFNLASVAFGDGIGIVRWPCGGEDAVQLGLNGAVFAQFNMDTESHDLVNADYVIGLPLTARFSEWSGRLRLFHQSSHLGDEFLLQEEPPPINRINLSYEELELLAAYQLGGFELYGGPARILHTETPLAKNLLRAGVNYASDPIGLGSARVVAGVDCGAWQETAWNPDLSVKAGLELNPFASKRIVRILVDWYHGHLPFGQFYTLKGEMIGIGFTLSW